MAPLTARATAPARSPAPVPRHAPARRPAPPRRPAARTVTRPRGAAVLDALLRSRVWIALIFGLLAGIVFFNVDLLRINRQIAVNSERSAAVGRVNARLRADIARLGSSERIQTVAGKRGLVLPAPGEVRYLRSRPTLDARNAAQALTATGAPQAGGAQQVGGAQQANGVQQQQPAGVQAGSAPQP